MKKFIITIICISSISVFIGFHIKSCTINKKSKPEKPKYYMGYEAYCGICTKAWYIKFKKSHVIIGIKIKGIRIKDCMFRGIPITNIKNISYQYYQNKYNNRLRYEFCKKGFIKNMKIRNPSFLELELNHYTNIGIHKFETVIEELDEPLEDFIGKKIIITKTIFWKMGISGGSGRIYIDIHDTNRNRMGIFYTPREPSNFVIKLILIGFSIFLVGVGFVLGASGKRSKND